jgi:O-antigen/teichoic acid export membrane protein
VASSAHDNTENENLSPALHRPSYSQGVFLTGAGTVISIALLFLETIVAARILDTNDLGVYVLLVVVVEFLVMVVDFGCHTAATQLIASSDSVRQEAIANTTLVLRAVLLAVVSLIIYASRDALLLLDPSGYASKYAFYVPAMLVVASFDELLQGLLQGFQAYRYMAIAQIVRSVLRAVLSVVFLTTLQWGVMGLIYSWIISFALSTAYQHLVLPIPKRLCFQQSLMKDVLRFGLPVQGMRVLWFVLVRINLMLVGVFTGPSGVAYLNVASRIPTAFFRLAQSYLTVYFPAVTEMLAEKRRARAHWILDQSLRLLSFILALGALIAVLFGQQFTVLLFSDKYEPSSSVFGLLMIELHMSVLLALMGYTLTAAGHPGRSLSQNVVRTALTLVANIFLIPSLGVIGSAYASLIGDYVTNPVCIQLLRRTDIQVAVAPFVKQTILLWLSVVVFWWLRPTAFVYTAGLIAVFLVLNLVLSTISVRDFAMVLPDAVAKRFRIRRETTYDVLW